MKRILIIDDNLKIRETLKLFLSIKGFECSEAVDGEDGWVQFKQIKPNLILLDYRMPKLDGLELLEKIRDEDKAVPVIMFSADREFEKIAKNCAVNKIIQKPFSLDVMVRSINEQLTSC